MNARSVRVRVRRRWPKVRREAGPWFAAFLTNIVVTGWVYALVEGVGPVEGPWWGIVTGSTTGYGDLYPESTAGRGVAAYLILSSIIIDRVMSAKIVQALLDEPNLYSHAEQERDEAANALVLAALARVVTFDRMPEHQRYLDALAAVAAEEASDD